MNSTSKPTPQFGWQHASVIALGLLVFVLLIFADKTNLKDEAEEPIATVQEEESHEGHDHDSDEVQKMRAMLAPVEPSEDIAALESQLGEAHAPAERIGLLQQIVAGYREAGQYDQAAIFAGILADEDPTPRNMVVAGALYRNANTMPALQGDTVVYRAFADKAIEYLERATKMAPEDEDAGIELGLAYIESRQPGMSMQGISKLVEIVDRNPKNTEALFYLGRFSMDTGQYEKAVQRYRQILENEPDNVRAKYFLAVSLNATGQSAEAKKYMTEVAEQGQDPELSAAATADLKKLK